MNPASTSQWTAAATDFKENFWEEVIGRLPKASIPVNARSRKILDNPKWTGYEVVLDVWPDVFAWGILLVPKDLKPGERRPVVVCQHGLEGVPMDTITRIPAAGLSAITRPSPPGSPNAASSLSRPTTRIAGRTSSACSSARPIR